MVHIAAAARLPQLARVRREPEVESGKAWGLTAECQGRELVEVAVLEIGGGYAGTLLAALDTLERLAGEVAARNHVPVPPFLA